MKHTYNFFSIYNRFMSECKSGTISTTAMALFQVLLCEANDRRWEMPFPYSTELLSRILRTSRQNLTNARADLIERGFISVEKGTGNGNPTRYTIIDKSQCIETQKTDSLTVHLTDHLTDSLTVNNNTINNNNNNRNARTSFAFRRSVDVIAATAEDYEGKF